MILDYKGISIFYTDTGKGNTVVLLHGFLENQSMWNFFVPIASQNHRIITIDLLGHGKTGNLGYIHTMEDMALAVDYVLTFLKIKNHTFIGHSMGGYVALAYAKKHVLKVNGICLMNSNAVADSLEKKENRDRAIKAIKQNHKVFIGMAISNLFMPGSIEIFKDDIEKLKKEALNMSVQGVIAALEGMKIRKRRLQFFKEAPFKKMQIIGLNDPVMDYHELKKQTKNSNIELVEFSDGHMSHIENKEELTYKLMHFIENI